jgi:predicted nucleotide-binding protein
MFIINALNYAAGLNQLLHQNLFNIGDTYLYEGLSVDIDKRTFAATVHTPRPAQNHLVIQVILPQVIPYNLHYLPVSS